MWTPENRPKYDRSKLRYPSDLTDEEWSIVGPLIPDAKGGGNKRTIDVRAVLNGVMYILSTGCQWAALPKLDRLMVSHGALVTAVSTKAFDQAIGMLRSGGTCVLVGLPPGGFPTPIFDVVLKRSGRRKRRPSMVGYIEDATLRSQIRVRFDAGLINEFALRQLEAVKVRLAVRSGDAGRLFGSVGFNRSFLCRFWNLRSA